LTLVLTPNMCHIVYCCVVHPSVHKTAEDLRTPGERRSWQSYARLKKSNNFTRPRTLITKLSWRSLDEGTVQTSPSAANESSVGGGYVAGGNGTGGTSVHAVGGLSPIASGSSSMTYAPKSSPSSTDILSPLESDFRLSEYGSSAAVRYLTAIDERLKAINRYVVIDTDFSNRIHFIWC